MHFITQNKWKMASFEQKSAISLETRPTLAIDPLERVCLWRRGRSGSPYSSAALYHHRSLLSFIHSTTSPQPNNTHKFSRYVHFWKKVSRPHLSYLSYHSITPVSPPCPNFDPGWPLDAKFFLLSTPNHAWFFRWLAGWLGLSPSLALVRPIWRHAWTRGW